MPASASASLTPDATILVNTLTDELNSDGDCSLREAIRAANLDQAVDACPAGSGADTIVLQSGVTYTLTRPGADDTAVNGDLDIADDLTITGSNAIIDANGATTNDRVIQVLGGNVVTISNVTLRNGRTTSFGAGIRSAGTLTLRSVTLSGNQSTGNAGGGLANEAGALAVFDSTITGNTASTLGGGVALLGGALQAVNLTLSSNTANSDRGGGLWVGTNASATLITSTVNNNDAGTNGGGIYNENNLSLLGSTVRNNQAGVAGGGVSEFGGGIYNEDTLVLSHSTVRNNLADDSAGISNDGGSMTIKFSTINNNTGISAAGMRNSNAATAVLTNSTVSSNSASASAGGIANSAGSTLQLSSVTVAFNVADSDANNSGDGGGLANAGTAVLRNSILGENVDASAGGSIFPDCSGGFTSDGYNLIENTTGCAIGGNNTGNITGVDPNLAALALNGGRTQTNAFPTGSPPHNTANPGGCVDNTGAAVLADQRDGARLNRCDMGAFEFAACLVIGDVDDDGDVDTLDIQQVATPWLGVATSPPLDLVVDGLIDIEDIMAVTARFGLVCS
jgi:CSLREA domain-containing protein